MKANLCSLVHPIISKTIFFQDLIMVEEKIRHCEYKSDIHVQTTKKLRSQLPLAHNVCGSALKPDKIYYFKGH